MAVNEKQSIGVRRIAMELNTDKNHGLKERKNGILSRLIKSSRLEDKQKIAAEEGHDEISRIIECIRDAKAEWTNANINFEFADEWEIIDYHTYQLKAYEVKYQYYLKRAKELGIKLSCH